MSYSSSPSPGTQWTIVAPLLFVLLWSSGFIGGKLSVPYAQPMMFLTLRYAGATLIFLSIAIIAQAPWPRTWHEVGHVTVAGLLLHIVFIGSILYAYQRGVEAGVAALIVSLQPLLTAVVVGPLLGEAVTRKQWVGLLCGLLGVILVVWHKLALGIGSGPGVAYAALALVGITAGTVYQKRFCSNIDLRMGNTIQFVTAMFASGLLSLSFESQQVEWTLPFVISLSWMTVGISGGAVALLYMMIRHGAVARVASLFYLVPPVTALMAWPLFGELLGPTVVVGMALTGIGVLLAHGNG